MSRSGPGEIIDTRADRLPSAMRALLADKAEAARLGEAGRRTAVARFHTDRFARERRHVPREVTS